VEQVDGSCTPVEAVDSSELTNASEDHTKECGGQKPGHCDIGPDDESGLRNDRAVGLRFTKDIGRGKDDPRDPKRATPNLGAAQPADVGFG
jgi:hypothetical protein